MCTAIHRLVLRDPCEQRPSTGVAGVWLSALILLFASIVWPMELSIKCVCGWCVCLFSVTPILLLSPVANSLFQTDACGIIVIMIIIFNRIIMILDGGLNGNRITPVPPPPPPPMHRFWKGSSNYTACVGGWYFTSTHLCPYIPLPRRHLSSFSTW